MNLKKIILSAALMGGVLSASAFATTAAAHDQVAKTAVFEAPVVSKTVSPVGLSRRLEGATVVLSMRIDEHGQPSNVQVVSLESRANAGNLVAAVSQWRFIPAKKDGVAIPSRVTLPVALVESDT